MLAISCSQLLSFGQENGCKSSVEGTIKGSFKPNSLDLRAHPRRNWMNIRMSSLLPNLGANASSRPNTFSAHQKHIQQILAVTFASVSILSGLLTFYWFLKLKRIYRHELIMLLVASNMFKAIWYLVLPTVILVQTHPFSSEFCLASGFLLATGIEASGFPPFPARQSNVGLIQLSDFIILLIALQTLLAIVRPGKSSGLHTYRYPAYACCALFSMLLPGLAFLNNNKDQAYISQGAFCYLPIRPIWFRLALSWVPRYIILCTIIGIYITIYLYVTIQFGKFDINLTSSTISAGPSTSDGTRDRPAAPTRTSHSSYLRSKSKEESQGAMKGPSASTRQGSLVPGTSNLSKEESSDPPPDPVVRKPTLLEALRDGSLLPARRNVQAQDVNLLRTRHKAIQRQLRYMFIYPLVYLVMWITPFINHCYYYTEQHNPPFILNSLALISVCLQCAADCLIFSIRERPWRGGAGGSASTGAKRSAGNGSDGEMMQMAGRNGREEMPDEVPQRSGIQSCSEQATREPRKEKNWWDNEII